MSSHTSQKRSIFVTLGIIIVSTVVTIMSLHALYTYNGTKERLVGEMRENAQTTLDTLNVNVGTLIEAYAVNEYEQLILTEMRHRGSFAIILQDFNMGKIIGKEAYISGKILDPKMRIIDYDPADVTHNSMLKSCYFSQSSAVKNDKGETLGVLSVYISDDAMNKELQGIITQTVINTLAISGLLIIALFFTINLFILRPLSEIVTAIGTGDKDGIPIDTIPHHGPKEIYDLSNSITEMLSAIKESRAKLMELNSRLNEKIKEGVEANTRLEKEKLEQEKMLIAQNKMASMGEMISAIAHQWRQPLNALGLDIQDLLDAHEYGELDEKYLQELVERSMHTIQYMSQTINDFRTFFLPNKEKESFSIHETVTATKKILEKQYAAHQITLTEKGKDFTVYGFKGEFQQVLINLFNNAKDAIIERQEEKPAFEGKITVTYDDHVITVADNGGGIPEDIIHRIFEPYFSTKFGSQGTGIGLYMTKTIIERNMAGEIKVFNQDDGALFQITLPKHSLDKS